MSFSFFVPTDDGDDLAQVLEYGAPGAATVEDDLPATGWPDGYVHVYLPGVSTRGIELHRDGGLLAVRLLTCSAPEEYELGVGLAAMTATLGGNQVTSEDGWELGPDELGRRLAAELTAAGPEDELPARLLAAMRRTQWTGEAYYPASVLELTGKLTGKKVSFALWSANACVIPDVELVMLHGTREEARLAVPRGTVPAFAGDRFTWLDEVQLLLEAVPEADWPAMRAAAEPYRVELPQ
jgi:hypothetical protein